MSVSRLCCEEAHSRNWSEPSSELSDVSQMLAYGDGSTTMAGGADLLFGLFTTAYIGCSDVSSSIGSLSISVLAGGTSAALSAVLVVIS